MRRPWVASLLAGAITAQAADGKRVHASKAFLDDKAIGWRVAQPRYRLP